ncbi:MAG: MFS transporter [Streptococcaceae bacterium]|jgi:predicted MFS family arabinose efflux permease|nr:MFS transporter [Streptococcaceae bacterium]
MKLNKRAIFLGSLIVFFSIIMFFTFYYFRSIGVNSQFVLEDINDIVTTKDGRFIVNKAKKEVIKSSGNSQIEYSIKEDRFDSASEVVDGKSSDDLYILDVELDGVSDIYVQKQRILKFTKGKFVDVVFEYKYPKKDLYRYEGNFQSLTYDNGNLYIIERQKKGFTLHKVDEKAKKLRKVKHFNFNNADKLLRTFVFKNDKMFALSKVGDVLQFFDDHWDVVYQAKDYQQQIKNKKIYSLPWDMVIANDGTLFATDIGSRSLLHINPISKEVKYLKQENTKNKPLSDQPLYYHLAINDKNQLFLSGDSSVVNFNQNNGKVKKIDILEVPSTLRMYSFIFIASLSILALIALFVLFLFLKSTGNYFKKNPNIRLEIGALFFVTITAALVSNMIINNYNERYKNELLEGMNMVATLTSDILDKDAFEKINSPQSYETKAYSKIRGQIFDVIKNDNTLVEGSYIDLYKVDNDIIYTCTNTNRLSGSYYPWEWAYEGSPEQKIIQTKKGIKLIREMVEGSYIYVVNPIFDDKENVIGLIEVGSSIEEYLYENKQIVRKVILGTISLIVVIMLLTRELFVSSETYQEWKKVKQENIKKKFISGKVVQPLVFAFYFVNNLAAAFMPNYSALLYTPFLGISKDVAIALPMTFGVLFIGLGFVGGTLSERFGFKKILNISLVSFALGLVSCGLSKNVWQLIIANSISGFGIGLGLVVVNVYVSSLKDKEERESSFILNNSAIFMGVNTGVIVGAALANLIGYRNVFYIAFIIVMIILSYVYYFFDDIASKKTKTEAKTIHFLKFLFKPRIFIYFIGVLLPYLACGYFLHYFFPIFGDDKGLSELEIGQAFLLNGIWVVFLGPVIAKFVLKKLGNVKTILLGLSLYAGAFASFSFNPTILIALVVLVIMGIADSFTFTAQNVYFTELKEVELYGVSKSMGVYSLFENLGQAIGPIIFSYIIMIGTRKGIIALCAVLLCLCLVFGFSNIFKARRDVIK